jgi:hypothetical protein
LASDVLAGRKVLGLTIGLKLIERETTPASLPLQTFADITRLSLLGKDV